MYVACQTRLTLKDFSKTFVWDSLRVHRPPSCTLRPRLMRHDSPSSRVWLCGEFVFTVAYISHASMHNLDTKANEILCTSDWWCTAVSEFETAGWHVSSGQCFCRKVCVQVSRLKVKANMNSFARVSVSVNKLLHEPHDRFYWKLQKLPIKCTFTTDYHLESKVKSHMKERSPHPADIRKRNVYNSVNFTYMQLEFNLIWSEKHSDHIHQVLYMAHDLWFKLWDSVLDTTPSVC